MALDAWPCPSIMRTSRLVLRSSGDVRSQTPHGHPLGVSKQSTGHSSTADMLPILMLAKTWRLASPKMRHLDRPVLG
jgi:hypothetical protein